MKKKKFLISIDTEGDNLWSWIPGKEITTENTKQLPEFQSLCDNFGFKPTYLTNFEMVEDHHFVDMFSKIQQDNRCEIGMHMHAWNSPPVEYELPVRTDGKTGQAYLIEYPEDVMEEKISFMTELIHERFGIRPITHRAGRWAMNETYFGLLDKYGYLADCSVTPGVDWTGHAGCSPDSGGSNYLNAEKRPYIVPDTGVMEIPMTIRKDHRFYKPERFRPRSIGGSIYRAIKGTDIIWMRPNGWNIDDMIWLSDYIRHSNTDYLMFMIHSSELAYGCNPRFKNKDQIDHLYSDLNRLFSHISNYYEGMTIGKYARTRYNHYCK